MLNRPSIESLPGSADSNRTGATRVEIFNAQGRSVKVIDVGSQPFGWHEESMELGYLPSGLYFIRVIEQGSSNTVALLKI